MNWKLEGLQGVCLGSRMVSLEALQPKEKQTGIWTVKMRRVQVSVWRGVGIKAPGGLGTKLPLKPSFMRGLERRVVGLSWESCPWHWASPIIGKI